MVDITPIVEKIQGAKAGARFYWDTMGWIGEGARLAENPRQFFTSKTGALNRAYIAWLTGKDWQGRPFTGLDELFHTGNLVKRSQYEKPEEGYWTTAPSTFMYQLQSMTPVLVNSASQYATGQTTAVTALAHMVGFPVKEKHNKLEDPQAIERAANAVGNIGNDYEREYMKRAMDEANGKTKHSLKDKIWPTEKVQDYYFNKRIKGKFDNLNNLVDPSKKLSTTERLMESMYGKAKKAITVKR
jgi:hypothetical protein